MTTPLMKELVIVPKWLKLKIKINSQININPLFKNLKSNPTPIKLSDLISKQPSFHPHHICIAEIYDLFLSSFFYRWHTYLHENLKLPLSQLNLILLYVFVDSEIKKNVFISKIVEKFWIVKYFLWYVKINFLLVLE